MNIKFRLAKRDDLPAILDIEEESFEFAWTEDDFLRCMRQRSTYLLVAETWRGVCGFVIYEPTKTGINILNLAVSVRQRRQGVGRAMVNKLKSKLSHGRREHIMLALRESNLTGQLFFRSQGFRYISTLVNYYPPEQTTEDAYVMRYLHSARMLVQKGCQ